MPVVLYGDGEFMMKHFYFVFLALLQSAFLLSHGFSADTLVLLADGGWQQISTVCYSAQKKKIPVASYDTTSSLQTRASVIRGGRSKANCHIRFAFADKLRRNNHATARERAAAGGFDERCKDSQGDAIACTPTQEFYCASKRQWVPAYKLNIGDELLCAHNGTKTVAYLALINEPLDIYTIEVKHTHAFFVTQYSILTHNMVLPLAFNIALSIPFGASAGGAAGSFFGPATLVIGAVAGCLVGAFFKILYDGHIPRYTVDAYNANMFEQEMQQKVLSYEPRVVPHVNYVNEQFDGLRASEETCSVAVSNDDANKPLCSITIYNQPKEKLGCIPGDVELFENQGCPIIIPEKPTILITPAEPMPFFQNPGCGAIPDELKELLNGPIMLTADETKGKIDKALEGATLVDIADCGAKIYTKPQDYNDAVKDFERMNLDKVNTAKNGDVIVGILPDGKRVNVRKTSKGDHKGKNKWPTLEVRSADGKRSKIKIRYILGNS